MFKEVNQKLSFPQMEEEILKYWKDNAIFKKSTENRKNKKKCVFFDGPPFANGLPHYGHILANVLKDAVARFWTMKGFFVPRVNGWDCHGLPVEYEIEKKLGLSGRKDVVTYGVEKFNSDCRKSVFTYVKEWESVLTRIGRWVDFEGGYATLENNYMESIWWIFKNIWDKSLIYSGFKSMHICPRCETPLSNFEVAQGYKDVTDLSLTAKFKLSKDALKALGKSENEIIYILAWTTTPWTLPGNTALAFGKNIDYVIVASKNDKGVDETYILADALKEKVLGEKNYAVLEKVNVKKLIDTHYEPLFDYYLNKDIEGKLYTIQTGDFVSTEDGTGVVHIAPMFGEDDYALGVEKGCSKIQHVKMDGTFKDDVTDFAQKFVKGQDGNVANFLDEKNLVFKRENFRHSYPHCWRCDSPLLNYSTRSFFVKVTEIKKNLLKNNKKIHWQPEHIKDGRFGKWLEGARDWSISRNRFWGCPIPVWECECGEMTCIGSMEELKNKSGGVMPKRGEELDLHKPYIDDVKIKCEKCGKMAKRVPDVLDCWFESGSMPYAQLHYPFENKEIFEKNFPADFIIEGLDQTRGWFYTLHVLSTILFNKPAFKNVIVNGTILAKDGEKMSKRKQNYTDPNILFNEKGVDAVRMALFGSNASLGGDVRFSDDYVDDVVKKFLLTLWNTYSFFVTYTNIDKWMPAKKYSDFVPSHKLDKWILSELNMTISEVSKSMDDFNILKSVRPLKDFLDNLSNWYIRRSRRRFWKSENDNDKYSAYRTLYIVLVEFSKVIAPFAPFISDEIFRNLTGKESVHLENWPKVNKVLIDEDLNREIKVVRTIVNLGHSIRSAKKIKVRQPLSRLTLALPEDVLPETVILQKDVILEELNVKSLEIIKEASDIVQISVKSNPKIIGPKYGKDVQFIINSLKNGEFELIEKDKVKIKEFVLSGDEIEVGFIGRSGFDVASESGIVVALDTNLNEALIKEGIARDIVRSVQELRKDADYKVDDRIILLIDSSGKIDDSVTDYSAYIKSETLATEIRQSGDLEWDKEIVIDFDGISVKIAVKKFN